MRNTDNSLCTSCAAARNYGEQSGQRSFVDDIVRIASLLDLDENGSLSQQNCTAEAGSEIAKRTVLQLETELRSSREENQSLQTQLVKLQEDLRAKQGRLEGACVVASKLTIMFSNLMYKLGTTPPNLEESANPRGGIADLSDLERKLRFLEECHLEENVETVLDEKTRLEAELAVRRRQSLEVSSPVAQNSVVTSSVSSTRSGNSTSVSHGVDLGRPGFVCSCGSEFPTEMGMKRHISHHTSESMFICNFCGARFHRESHLRRHASTNHPVNMSSLGCSLCGKRFASFVEILKHRETDHRQQSSEGSSPASQSSGNGDGVVDTIQIFLDQPQS